MTRPTLTTRLEIAQVHVLSALARRLRRVGFLLIDLSRAVDRPADRIVVAWTEAYIARLEAARG